MPFVTSGLPERFTAPSSSKYTAAGTIAIVAWSGSIEALSIPPEGVDYSTLCGS
jgi:hypothetical protein